MNKEEFEAVAKECMEKLREAWRKFLDGTAWVEQNPPLCVSIFLDSVSAFSMDDDREYIVNVYKKHHDS